MATRFRSEEGASCIDIRVRRVEQLFDGRDPAPFRERDLDAGAVDYLVGAMEELPAGAAVRIVVSVEEPLPPTLPADEVAAAIAAHFAYEEARVGRALRRHVRHGQAVLLVGLVGLALCLGLEELLTMFGTGHAVQVLKNGLVIIGWVAMWRPVEALLYDWWPLLGERKLHRRLREARCDVKVVGA